MFIKYLLTKLAKLKKKSEYIHATVMLNIILRIIQMDCATHSN